MISHSTGEQHRRHADRGLIAADDLFGQAYYLHMRTAALLSVKKAQRFSFGLEHAALHQMRKTLSIALKLVTLPSSAKRTSSTSLRLCYNPQVERMGKHREPVTLPLVT